MVIMAKILSRWRQRFKRSAVSPDVGDLGDVAGRLRTAGWRQVDLAYIAELRAHVEAIRATRHKDKKIMAILDGVERNLDAARDAAARARLKSAEDRSINNLRSAETGLLRVVPEDELHALALLVEDAVKRHLELTDPRRVAVEERLAQTTQRKSLRRHRNRLTNADRELLVQALQAAYYASAIERRRQRSFRNVVWAGTFVLSALAALLLWLGTGERPVLELCFPQPQPRACPAGYISPTPPVTVTTKTTVTAMVTVTTTAKPKDPDPPPRPSAMPSAPADRSEPGGDGYDILVVEAFGLVAAALTAAVALRKMFGTKPPYTIPLALSLLKLPAGAVSAVLGLALINGGLIPGLNNLTTPGEILAWAALFGAGQQALTQFVDQRGREVLKFGHPETEESDSSQDD